ncbi:hypothetical protein CALVIDRAFT_486722, partial [Calocera viscosa TUFC12733]
MGRQDQDIRPNTELIDIIPVSDDVLKELPYASHARYERGKQCLENTRKDLLDDITDCINSTEDDESRIYFLHGPTGTGKSAIAHSVAVRFDDRKHLGSSFMINSAYRHPSSDILPTIARDISDLDPSFKAALYRAIKARRSDRSISDLEEQFKLYLLQPCEALEFNGSIVIVLNGLDE